MEHNLLSLSELPLPALATFECVARHLHFARAAGELRVTPTAVSKTIAQLASNMLSAARLDDRTSVLRVVDELEQYVEHVQVTYRRPLKVGHAG